MFRFAFGLAALLLAFTAGGASAQTMSYAEAGALIAKSCGPSIERFCAKDNLGTGEVRNCLMSHQDQVPQQCFDDYAAARASIAKRIAAQSDAYSVCSASAREFCAGIQPGDANLLTCLQTASKVVRPACKQTLTDAGWWN
ncbi:cysteine rich repeat-containing protein [Starkeya koreensis]|uniref:Cysteine rich repeat-containing protein n=1 Tax=Ancylobacter koreensis TaxID=266121 RepID=A0ABT0DNQ0_9HYPH|nr:cysteine rich repeat-containing protein [Ancylobacter koreensis]MCK0208901.1 cysteine rich repeat-containing protein [Ancylobacter koreensis]